jgi:hypothetical protein
MNPIGVYLREAQSRAVYRCAGALRERELVVNDVEKRGADAVSRVCIAPVISCRTDDESAQSRDPVVSAARRRLLLGAFA